MKNYSFKYYINEEAKVKGIFLIDCSFVSDSMEEAKKYRDEIITLWEKKHPHYFTSIPLCMTTDLIEEEPKFIG